MIPVYLYNNYHAGDLLFSRPLYRALAASGRFELVIAAHRNNAYLFEDLVGPGVRLYRSDYLERGPTVLYDLGADAPPGYLPVDTWLGAFSDTGNHQWRNVVEVCRRQLAAHGIDWQPEGADVPMVDFAPRPLGRRLSRPAIYVDNSPCRSGQSDFEFDIRALARVAAGHLVVCTRRPEVQDENVVDASQLDLRDLSAISEQCSVILGKGSGPFCCTYTEANRYRPRAVCGYRSELSPTFWDYPDNPLRYLDTMDEVLELVASVVGAPEATPC